MAMVSASKEELEKLYYVDMKSLPDISRILGINYSATRNTLLSYGIKLRSRADGVRAASFKISEVHKGVNRVFTKEWCENISSGRIKWAEENAKGVSLKPNGYLEYTRGPNKGRLVHVVVAEENILGRRILPGEHVHHKDLSKTNNEVENLEVLSISEHTSLHAKLRHSNRSK